ncbi:zinc finger protein 37-like isoform X1 [Haliotis rufescens]|uniref:zinc finger protein 37-like isoform X1 n=1 Tax=Haliotis rufescens TaxID=6454 RepID=UPI00201F1DCF|nr:zinc finger protein 37-like isoform X1 [Haliotis rufescens]
MEKQYSVEFFMNFVENIQNLCHNFLEFNQNVEVSGYVCVDIDNMKKERYVLSEIVQMGGNSISESYCTKVFKTTPTGTVQRSGFRDITNARVPSAATSSGEVNVPGHSYSSQRMRTGHQRKSETSHTLSLNMAVSPRSQTKTAIDQSYSVFQGHNASSNSNSSFVNPSVTGIQGRESGPGDSQNRTKSRQLTPKVCRPATVPDSSVLKRRCEPSPLSDSADDADVIVVKQEPCDEEREEHGDQPPVKRRSETFRLPSSLTGGALPVIQHPHPAPSSSNTRGEDKSYFSSSSKETSNSTHHKDKKPDLSVEEIQNLEDYEVELVPSDAEEESLDLTFQVAHPGGAVQSSVIGAQDPGNFPSTHIKHAHTIISDKNLHPTPEQGMLHDNRACHIDGYQAGVEAWQCSQTQPGGIVYSCEQCFQTFTSICDLKTHALKLHHNTYVCDWCGKQLKSSHGYKLHCNSHAGDYRYICPICDKRFQQSSHLEGHINTHNSVRPFKCPTCFKGFSYRFSMTKHAKTCRNGISESGLD